MGATLRWPDRHRVSHLSPMRVLLLLDGIRVFVPLQPESEPVEVALVGGQLVLRLKFLVRLVWKHIHVRSMVEQQRYRIVERVEILLLGHLQQKRCVKLVQIVRGREDVPSRGRLGRRSKIPDLLQSRRKAVALQAVEEVIKKVRETGMRAVEVFIKGPGAGRDAALRAIRNSGLTIAMIADITPIPHNGPRMKKKRRV